MNLSKRSIMLVAILGIAIPAGAQWCTVTDTSMVLRQVISGTVKPADREELYIPVVFNVAYEKEEENIPDNQILSQLEVLNEDFSGNNTDLKLLPAHWQAIAGKAGIHFCLYCGENGAPGIQRKKIDRRAYGNTFSVMHTDAGGIDALDPQHALNVWVAPLDGQVTGFANPVHQYGLRESGVVVDYRHLGRLGKAIDNLPFNLGRTLTHEIGHYFGLLHVWGNYSDECTEDDLVDDTPFQSAALYDCPGQMMGCESEANVNNFMNLVDDRCMSMFTVGQVQRMKWYIATFLPELSNPTACSATNLNYRFQTNDPLLVFPNPNNGAFALQNATGQTATVSLFDAAGRIVFADIASGPYHLFDLSRSLSGGIYFMVMSTPNATATSKIMIIH